MAAGLVPQVLLGWRLLVVPHLYGTNVVCSEGTRILFFTDYLKKRRDGISIKLLLYNFSSVSRPVVMPAQRYTNNNNCSVGRETDFRKIKFRVHHDVVSLWTDTCRPATEVPNLCSLFIIYIYTYVYDFYFPKVARFLLFCLCLGFFFFSPFPSEVTYNNNNNSNIKRIFRVRYGGRWRFLSRGFRDGRGHVFHCRLRGTVSIYCDYLYRRT